MRAERTIQMRSILAEIAKCCEGLPPKHKHPIINRCNKVKVLINKMDKDMPESTTIKVSTPEEGKYIAKRAIFDALMAGRHLSQLDCREFMVEDMRTPISHMRNEIAKTHTLCSKWIKTPVRNTPIKEYWLEPKEEVC